MAGWPDDDSQPSATAGPRDLDAVLLTHAHTDHIGRTGPQIMPSGLNADTPRALASLANIEGISAGMLLPGHGDPWTGGVPDAIRRARTAGPS